jgi:hypothetical protein
MRVDNTGVEQYLRAWRAQPPSPGSASRRSGSGVDGGQGGRSDLALAGRRRVGCWFGVKNTRATWENGRGYNRSIDLSVIATPAYPQYGLEGKYSTGLSCL